MKELNETILLLEKFRPRESDCEASYLDYESYFRGSERALRGRLEELEFLVDDVLTRCNHAGSWLDIGSGAGDLLGIVQSRNIESYGIESDASLARQANASNHRTFCGKANSILRELRKREVKFDVVTCLHVIEHLEWSEANRLVELMGRVVSEYGIIVTVTPNVKHIDVVAGSFYRDPTHVRQYSPELLEFIFSRNGLNPVFRETFNRFYDKQTLLNERKKFNLTAGLIDEAEALRVQANELLDSMADTND